jgi:RNA polymerase II subunit A-like phosphatase
MADPTDLFLPTNFPYPIKVISLDAPPRSPVQRGTRLLSYSFVYHSKVPDTRPATRFGTWDSAIEGDIKKWNIKVGDTVTLQQAKARAAVVVVEPCKHGVQLGGLCALCGKDLTMYVQRAVRCS